MLVGKSVREVLTVKKIILIFLMIPVMILAGCKKETQVKLLDTVDQIQGMEAYNPTGTLAKAFSENVFL